MQNTEGGGVCQLCGQMDTESYKKVGFHPVLVWHSITNNPFGEFSSSFFFFFLLFKNVQILISIVRGILTNV